MQHTCPGGVTPCCPATHPHDGWGLALASIHMLSHAPARRLAQTVTIPEPELNSHFASCHGWAGMCTGTSCSPVMQSSSQLEGLSLPQGSALDAGRKRHARPPARLQSLLGMTKPAWRAESLQFMSLKDSVLMCALPQCSSMSVGRRAVPDSGVIAVFIFQDKHSFYTKNSKSPEVWELTWHCRSCEG